MVAELRAKTDAPMMECKKALTEADGDMAKAEELLRVKLGTKAGKAASRVTAEGVIVAFTEGNTGAMLEVNCETDFVTKNDSFLALANAAAKLAALHNPADVAALGELPYTQDGFGPTLEEVRKGLIGKIGETLSIVKCMVLTAEKISGRPLFRLDNIAEYSSRIISTGRHILGAAASSTMQFDTYNTTDDANTARGCANTLVKGVGSFLQCAVPRVVGARRRRRLLSEPLAAVWEQHGPSMASRTRVLNTPPPAPSPPPAPRAATSAAGVDVALIAGIVVAVTVALVICVLLVARRRRTTQYARLPTAAAALTHFLAADRHDELVHQPPSPRQYIVLRHGRPRSLGRKNEA
jgi:hypothetical protein